MRSLGVRDGSDASHIRSGRTAARLHRWLHFVKLPGLQGPDQSAQRSLHVRGFLEIEGLDDH